MRKVHIIRGLSEKGCIIKRQGVRGPSFRWVVRWRIVDAKTGQDVVQPYFDRRYEAIDCADEHGWDIAYIEPYSNRYGVPSKLCGTMRTS